MLGRRLDRHLIRSVGLPFLSCLAGLAVLVVFFDLFDRVDECFRLIDEHPRGLGRALAAVGIFYLEQALSFVASYGGLAALAAAALAVAALARNSELTAMRASGVSLRRSFVPLLLFGALAGAGQLWLADSAVRRLAPAAEEAQNDIYRRTASTEVQQEKSGSLAVWAAEEKGGEETQIWSGRCKLILRARNVGSGGRRLEGLSVEVWPAGSLSCYYLTAESATWRDRYWHLKGGKFYEHREDRAFRPGCTRIRCRIAPTELEAGDRGLRGVDSRKLYALRDDPAARVEIWRRWSLPLIDFTLLLLGLPLAVVGGSRGGKLLPLGMALMLGVVFILSVELGAELARSNALYDLLVRFGEARWLAAAGGPSRLAVDLAMAAPCVVFLAVGAVLYRRMDRY